MATTPTYGFRYPAITDPPNGAVQIQNLATDVEAKFVTNDAAISALQNPTFVGGEYEGTGQSINPSSVNNAITKLSFSTTGIAAAGITWNGSNQFTVLTSGTYALTAVANMGFVSTASWAVAIHDGAGYPTNRYQAWAGPQFGQTNAITSGTKYLTAGSTISCYAYNNENVARTLVGARFSVHRVA